MKQLFLCLCCVTAGYFATAQVDNDVLSIRKLLLEQVVAWNNGNVTGYMQGYWHSDSLVFIGSNGPNYGFDATLKRYKEHYPDAAHMGHLKSTIVDMKKLSDDYYFIIGKWALTRTAGNVSGSYTLLLHRINGRWVIVCDHSS